MRKLIYLIFATFILISCSDDINETVAERNNFQHRFTEFPDLTDDFNGLMTSFVESLRPFYEKGMSYSDFKTVIDPEDQALIDIKREGDLLLEQAFLYIQNDVDSLDFSGELYMDAFFASIVYNEHMFGLDITEITAEDYDVIFADLFGLTIESTGLTTFNKSCKWYQVGCHSNNAINWVNNIITNIATWWNTPAPGDGGMTNGQVLTQAVATTAAVVGLVLLIL